MANAIAPKSPPGEPDQANTENRGAPGRARTKGRNDDEGKTSTGRHDLRELAGSCCTHRHGPGAGFDLRAAVDLSNRAVRRIGNSNRQLHALLSRKAPRTCVYLSPTSLP